MGLVIATLPAELRAIPKIPWWLERVGLLVGGIWFVNLVNFMDGIDWITVAEVVPITAALVLFGAMGALPSSAMVVATALGGAMIGFAPFNKPVARLSSATACRSDCCWAGCWCCWPAMAVSSLPCCSRSTT